MESIVPTNNSFTLKQLFKLAIVFLQVILTLSCQTGGVTEEVPKVTNKTIKLAVISDPHFYDTSLGTTGEAFEAALLQDRKLLRESKAIFEQTMNEIRQTDAEVILISGDITKDGERVNHEKVVTYLAQLKAQGKRVFVVPGNHDINNPFASQYSGKSAVKIPTVNPAEFAQIYAPFGFQDALARDPNSLSYVTEAAPGWWILAMDACRYNENTATSSKTGGKFSAETLTWILSRLDEAAKKGVTVIGMMHHGLTEHFTGQSILFPDYVIEDWQNTSKKFADKGMKLVFTGHYHAHDITRAAGTGENFVLDCETSSLVTSPCAYRLVSYSPEGTLTVHSKKITSISGNTNFENYARNNLLTGIQTMVATALVNPPYSLSQANVTLAAPTVSAGVMQHYQGDEVMDASTSFLIQTLTGMGGNYILLAANAKNMVTDLPPSDNELTYTMK